MKNRFGDLWDFSLSPVGVEFRRPAYEDAIQHLFFNLVRDDEEGLRIQPAVGVTLPSLNSARDRITPRHAFTVDYVTAFVLLNDLLPRPSRQLGGWLFLRGCPLNPSLDELLDLVETTVSSSDFFPSLKNVSEYIQAVETARWPLVATMPTYLYALLETGQMQRVERLALKQIDQMKTVAEQRGLVLHESEMQEYKDIVRAVSRLSTAKGANEA